MPKQMVIEMTGKGKKEIFLPDKLAYAKAFRRKGGLLYGEEDQENR